jgi:4-alpha-glucanotransferase
MFTNGLICIQDASEALFFRSAFKNVIFNATEGVKKESQSVSLIKSLDPEGIIYIKTN